MSKCIVCGKESKKFRNYKGFNILICNACGMIFVDPKQISDDNYKQYEDNKSSPAEYYKRTEKHDIKSFNQRLDFIETILPSKGSLFEIGCNTGLLLRLAKKRGWNCEGVEPNKAIFDEFKEINKGLTIHNAYFGLDLAEKLNKKFDIIYSEGVIEHIIDPVSFLKAAKSVLAPGGTLIICAPDYDSILTKLFQIKPLEHVVYYDKRNVKELYKIVDLKITSIIHFHRYYDTRSMLYSTTFKDKNNRPEFMILVKIALFFRLNWILEFILSFFKEHIVVVSKIP